ncbi:MAG: 23S rRNA (guanosine(2251)-2'-O)-methyltransferase RlmB [Proteobacteria bacterium]|nr:23S rRNA (guanosine(2251)-2'-O)-methyltransferase RlmB [Pseudomonadota bacterium]MCL2307859.1 23S rRNA (guanosine(2251)-2'-O)-methyltransferase RlmB [Pseudomonadota bacterium]
MSSSKILFGFHAVIARLRQHPDSVETLFYDANRQDPRLRDLLERAALAGCAVQPVESARLDGLAPAGRHQGVVARVTAALPHLTLDDVLDGADMPLLMVLDGVTDPHNLGACLRSADAFGVQALILPKDRSVSVNATVAKVACGAADTVPVVTVTNLARTLEELKARGIWCVAADSDGENVYDADLSGPLAWVLGAEGSGLRRLTRERCDRVVSIPLQGMVESLNVSVAAGICLAATQAQRYRASRGKK